MAARTPASRGPRHTEKDLSRLQPIFQKRLWDRFPPGSGPEKMAKVIDDLKREDSRFHTEGGSWTNNISWVKGYDSLLDPIQRASAHFYEKVIQPRIPAGRAVGIVMPCFICSAPRPVVSATGVRAPGRIWPRDLPPNSRPSCKMTSEIRG